MMSIPMRGRLERIANANVVGWLWNKSKPDVHVTFDLIINGVAVGTFVADRMRNDLLQAGIGDGRHGFRVPLKPEWLSQGENVITVSTSPAFNNQRDTVTFVGISPPNVEAQKFKPRGKVKDAPDQPQETSKADGASPVLPPAEVPAGMPAVSNDGREPVKPALTIAPKPARRPKPGAAGPQSVATPEVIDLLKGLLAAGQLAEPAIASLTEALFKAGRYQDVILIGCAAAALIEKSYRVQNHLGRSLLNVGRVEEAVAVLQKVQALEPKRHGAIFFLGAAYLRLQQFEAAYEVFKSCIAMKADDAKYHLEAGRAAVGLAFGGYGVAAHQDEFLPVALEHLREAARLAPKDFRAPRELAPLLLHVRDFDGAYASAKDAVARNSTNAAAWLTLSTICMRLDKRDEALETAQKALEIDPTGDATKFAARILQRFRREGSGNAPLTLTLTSGAAASLEAAGDATVQYRARGTQPLRAFLEDLTSEWVGFDLPPEPAQEYITDLQERGFQWAAGVAASAGQGLDGFLWRRSFLLRLLSLGLLGSSATEADLAAAATRHGALSRRADDPVPARPDRPVAMLVSQYGVHKFGGAEQFLEQMAHLYTSLGYDVLLVGTRAEFIGESGRTGDVRYTFVENSPDELFRLAVEENAYVIHVVSGLGLEIAAAMRHLDVRLVFGVHFWRELFYNPTPSGGYYPDIDREALPRPEFQIVLEDFAAVYSNSHFTRGVVETNFAVDTPVIYSLPDDVSNHTPVPASERSGILLVNARADKGFSLTLDIAERLPSIPFIAIASQSGRFAAEAEVNRRGLPNVTILSRVSDMPALYQTSRVVLVPSFRFVETFSRVVIEAQRYGVPVIGSDRGNVPWLLTESGTSLPEDADLWAAEVKRLYESDAYWQEKSEAALKNSEQYGFSQQRERLSGLLSSVEKPVLVGVGSGLGNVIHTTPLIRNLARRLGQRVDVVVAGDYADLLFCLANREYVNHVFLLGDAVLNRRYDTVFLTHSFGMITPRFSARRVVRSRDWDLFVPEHPLHEAEFNLAAAWALLDVPYDPEDVQGYFLGEMRYTPPAEPLVGFHGGSKGGVWATKRWPHYEKLAQELQARGLRVASFGTPEEYVPGTINMTGGSIQEMARSMLACSYFIANDSGVMNVANALGIPLTAIFAPTNALTRGPLGKTSTSVAVEKDCSPCEMHVTERQISFLAGYCKCIGEITVEAVLQTMTLPETASRQSAAA
ncbi:glycosyltransferase family 9 protein [Microvirga sp. 0TCS3.31]